MWSITSPPSLTEGHMWFITSPPSFIITGQLLLYCCSTDPPPTLQPVPSSLIEGIAPLQPQPIHMGVSTPCPATDLVHTSHPSTRIFALPQAFCIVYTHTHTHVNTPFPAGDILHGLHPSTHPPICPHSMPCIVSTHAPTHVSTRYALQRTLCTVRMRQPSRLGPVESSVNCTGSDNEDVSLVAWHASAINHAVNYTFNGENCHRACF